jgi:hypothetical protein
MLLKRQTQGHMIDKAYWKVLAEALQFNPRLMDKMKTYQAHIFWPGSL